jgi:hypothetical protein
MLGAAPLTITVADTVYNNNDPVAKQINSLYAANKVSITSQPSNFPRATSANPVKQTIEMIIDGGGSAITTGFKGFIEIPYACVINTVRLLADQSGSIVIDIWKDTYANYPPVVGDSITASAKPTISSATKSESSTLTGWTKSVSAGDILGFNVDSVTTVQRVTISLTVTRV